MKERISQQRPSLIFNSELLDVVRGENMFDGEEQDASDSIVSSVVRAVLQDMDTEEREVLISFFFEGKSVGDISKIIGGTPVQVNNIKNRAIENFSKLMLVEKEKCFLTPEYNQCVICDHDQTHAIDEYIHVWLDAKGGGFRGILTQLKNKFDLVVPTMAEVIAHIKFHMRGQVVDSLEDKVWLKGDGENRGAEAQEPKKHYIHNLNIDPEVKKSIDALVEEFDQSFLNVIRQALELGVPMLRHIYEMNIMMTKAAIKLAKVQRNISPYI